MRDEMRDNRSTVAMPLFDAAGPMFGLCYAMAAILNTGTAALYAAISVALSEAKSMVRLTISQWSGRGWVL